MLLHWTKEEEDENNTKREGICWMKSSRGQVVSGRMNNIESLIGLHAKVTAHANAISCAANEKRIGKKTAESGLWPCTHSRQSACSSSPDSNILCSLLRYMIPFRKRYTVPGAHNTSPTTYRKMTSARSTSHACRMYGSVLWQRCIVVVTVALTTAAALNLVAVRFLIHERRGRWMNIVS